VPNSVEAYYGIAKDKLPIFFCKTPIWK
jgi:hypothetical protein